MNNWDRWYWEKHTNPSGEVIRTKTFIRTLPAWDNYSVRTLYSQRKKLADMLGVPITDLLCDLEITIKCDRYRRHRRFLRYMPWKVTGSKTVVIK